jgi:predicted metalloprotease with PDZ domain
MKVNICIILGFIVLLLFPTMAQADYNYQLRWGKPGEFTYYVSLSTAKNQGSVTRFQIPAWRPGRYIMQNFAAAVSHFEAFDEKNQPLVWKKVHKDIWEVQNPTSNNITIKYRYYAAKVNAGSSYVDDQVAYFNPSNLFMHVEGRYNDPCSLEIQDMPAGWKVASGLRKTKLANAFTAPTYHEFIDCPTILSAKLVTFPFKAEGIQCYAHFYGNYGAPAGAEKALTQNISKIITAQKQVFGEIPCTGDYHFIYYLVPFRLRHAVEHLNSSMYVLPESVAQSESAFNGLYGITSHEFWHVWNVKTVRPAAIYPYDYSKEQYTRLHWFTEGVTDYYTYLMLVRAGLTSRKDFFAHQDQVITGLENNYAQTVVSPEHSSFDSWLGPSEYNNPAHAISFYELGGRVGLLLDLEMRKVSKNKLSLDDIFKRLYFDYYKKDKGYPEDAVLQLAEQLTGKSFQAFFTQYVSSPAPINYESILQPLGFKLEKTPQTELNILQLIGIENIANAGELVQIKEIKPYSDAMNSGLYIDDIILSINDKQELKDWASIIPAQGETVTFKVKRYGNEKSISVAFSGKDMPYNYKFSATEKVSPEFLDSWLGKNSQ